jgi:uncharacterized protein (DUF849 family)
MWPPVGAVHLHVRNPETGVGTRDPALFADLTERVRRRGLRSILNLTCGGGAKYIPSPENDAIAGPGTDVGTVENRTQHIRENRPEVCSLDVTTQNQMDGTRWLPNLRGQILNVKNVIVADGAAFASNADKNPTLTIMALAWRAADHLLEMMRRRDL